MNFLVPEFQVWRLPTPEEIEAFDPCPLTDRTRQEREVAARAPIDEPPAECRIGDNH